MTQSKRLAVVDAKEGRRLPATHEELLRQAIAVTLVGVRSLKALGVDAAAFLAAYEANETEMSSSIKATPKKG